jgi:hypothetical protein
VIRCLIVSSLSLAAIGVATVPAIAAGDVLSGMTLTQLMCTRCHITGLDRPGGHQGPPLPRVINRLGLDEDALRVRLSQAHLQTPDFNLQLRPRQIDDIVAYLDTLRVR